MQTNFQPGELVFPAKVDLEGKEDYLVKLVNDSGVAKVNLPGATTDITPYVVTDTNKGADANCSVLPIQPGRNFRAKLHGTCVPGATLVLAGMNDGATVAGMVESIPATAGNYRVIGIAEEAGVDGQSVLVRAYFDLITVTE